MNERLLKQIGLLNKNNYMSGTTGNTGDAKYAFDAYLNTAHQSASNEATLTIFLGVHFKQVNPITSYEVGSAPLLQK